MGCQYGPLTRESKIAGCACVGNAGDVFHRLQRKPLVNDPGMHHGTYVTHVPWCMSGSLNRGGVETGFHLDPDSAQTLCRQHLKLKKELSTFGSWNGYHSWWRGFCVSMESIYYEVDCNIFIKSTQIFCFCSDMQLVELSLSLSFFDRVSSHLIMAPGILNTLRPRQNGPLIRRRHFQMQFL